jgi:NAD(P)H-binding
MERGRLAALAVLDRGPSAPAPAWSAPPGDRRMESLVRASDLEWTIVRSCWLFDAAAVTDYRLAENSACGLFTARADLAASMLAQLARGHHETEEAVVPWMPRGW